MKKTHLVALVSGLLFAIGLGVSGMTDPSKVIGFLDVAGAWDPSLAFVMAGAVGVHFLFARRAVRKPVTLDGRAISLPIANGIDPRLVGGAALFGIGWGIAGYCPGPSLVSLAGGSTSAILFVSAMVVGSLAVRWVVRRGDPGPSLSESKGEASEIGTK